MRTMQLQTQVNKPAKQRLPSAWVNPVGDFTASLIKHYRQHQILAPEDGADRLSTWHKDAVL